MEPHKLYQYIKEINIDWKWEYNEQTKKQDVLILPTINEIQSLYEKLSSHHFNDEGIVCNLKDGYFAIWLSQITDLNLEEAFENYPETLTDIERVNKQYWIDRSGVIHKFDGDLTYNYSSLHHEIAKKIYPNAEYPEDILSLLGWVLVGSTVYGFPIIYGVPTKKQIRTLYKYDLYEDLSFSFNGKFLNYDKYLYLCK